MLKRAATAVAVVVATLLLAVGPAVATSGTVTLSEFHGAQLGWTQSHTESAWGVTGFVDSTWTANGNPHKQVRYNDGAGAFAFGTYAILTGGGSWILRVKTFCYPDGHCV